MTNKLFIVQKVSAQKNCPKAEIEVDKDAVRSDFKNSEGVLPKIRHLFLQLLTAFLVPHLKSSFIIHNF